MNFIRPILLTAVGAMVALGSASAQSTPIAPHVQAFGSSSEEVLALRARVHEAAEKGASFQSVYCWYEYYWYCDNFGNCWQQRYRVCI